MHPSTKRALLWFVAAALFFAAAMVMPSIRGTRCFVSTALLILGAGLFGWLLAQDPL